jgi:hypothetical protein
MKLLGIIIVGSVVTDYYGSHFLHSADTRKKFDYNGTVHQLFVDFKKPMTQLREKFFTIFCLNLVYLRN